MLYLNSTLNLGIPPVFVFQLEVYYKVDRLLTGLTAQQKGTTSQWYSIKTSLLTVQSNVKVHQMCYQNFSNSIRCYTYLLLMLQITFSFCIVGLHPFAVLI